MGPWRLTARACAGLGQGALDLAGRARRAAWRWASLACRTGQARSPRCGSFSTFRLRGRTVTADAMHCQRETAQAILDKGADYVLGLKANRFAMYDDAVLFLDDPAVQADTAAQTLDAALILQMR